MATDDVQHEREVREDKKRRLKKLELRQARLGYDTDPATENEIEDLTKCIREVGNSGRNTPELKHFRTSSLFPERINTKSAVLAAVGALAGITGGFIGASIDQIHNGCPPSYLARATLSQTTSEIGSLTGGSVGASIDQIHKGHDPQTCADFFAVNGVQISSDPTGLGAAGGAVPSPVTVYNLQGHVVATVPASDLQGCVVVTAAALAFGAGEPDGKEALPAAGQEVNSTNMNKLQGDLDNR
jgi:hypothetical protein